MAQDTFRVIATSLNLRSAPVKLPDNILAVLSRGQIVERLSGARGAEFWRVRTNLNGVDAEGHVAAEFLTPVLEAPAPGTVPAARLAENRPSSRRDAPPNAFPIGEADRPRCPPKSLADIADWMDVEHSRRYRPVPDGPTFCNIYAHDYCYLANVYLPRVWWNPAALADLLAGRQVSATTRTAHEMRANDISTGWTSSARASAGSGSSIPRRSRRPRTAVRSASSSPSAASWTGPGMSRWWSPRPATIARRAERNRVIAPLQTQAGRQNFRHGTSQFWMGSEFRQFAFWRHKAESRRRRGRGGVLAGAGASLRRAQEASWNCSKRCSASSIRALCARCACRRSRSISASAPSGSRDRS